MSDILTVHVNRDRPQAIEAETDTFRTDGRFVVALKNHGRPVHVHLHLDDDLSTVASLDTGNHYVDADSVTEVPVAVEGSRRPVSGKLKVVTGYGARTEYVDVELTEPRETDERVQVDETLARPQRRSDEPDAGPLGNGPVVRNVAIATLGGFALLLAAIVTSVTASGTVLVGSIAVLLGVGVAAYLVARR